MHGRISYLEDFQVGEGWVSAPVTLDETSIVAFAKANDLQPMPVDPDWASTGPFGTLIASGWQVAALSMRLFIEVGGYGRTPLVGLGVKELCWLMPVKAGDTLTVERDLVEVTRSASRPDRGAISTRVSVRNQHGVEVLTMVSVGRVQARSDGS